MVAVGIAGAGVAAPLLLLGGGNAFGTWTSTPAPLTDLAAADAAMTCRANLGAPAREGRVAVAERRGGWTYVLLVSPTTEAICLMPNDFVGQGNPARDEGFFGSYAPDASASGPPTLAPDRVVAQTSGQGSTGDGYFFWLEGYVGTSVTGVTIHTSSGLDVEASVVANRFAAWWPGIAQSSHHPAETWSYTVHLADGSSRRTR